MSLIAILAALGLEQWRAFDWRASVERAFVSYARTLERKFNGGTYQHGIFATVAAIVPPVLLAGQFGKRFETGTISPAGNRRSGARKSGSHLAYGNVDRSLPSQQRADGGDSLPES